jgi:hypothetical protein
MLTIEKAHTEIQRWYDNGCVGNLTIFRAPKSDYVDIIGEETVKLFEMDDETKAAVRKTFELLDSEKIELFRDRNGYPDRARVVRRI